MKAVRLAAAIALAAFFAPAAPLLAQAATAPLKVAAMSGAAKRAHKRDPSSIVLPLAGLGQLRIVALAWGCECMTLLSAAPAIAAAGGDLRGFVLQYGSLESSAFFEGPSYLVVRAGADDAGVNPSIDAAAASPSIAGLDLKVLDCPGRLNAFEFSQPGPETDYSLDRIVDYIRGRLED